MNSSSLKYNKKRICTTKTTTNTVRRYSGNGFSYENKHLKPSGLLTLRSWFLEACAANYRGK